MRVAIIDGSQVVQEAALPMNTSHSALRGHLKGSLMSAHGVTDAWSQDTPWITDVFPEHVVYQHKNQTYRRSYTSTEGPAGTDPTIKLGDAKKVHMAYVDSKESEGSVLLADKESVIITPKTKEGEAVVREGVVLEFVKESKTKGLPSTIPVKIIQAGWGASAYYSKEMIKRDGPSVFKKGTQMFWNHATESQEAERPEGDLNDLAAVLVENAKWDENGAKGPGLYSTAKVFSDYAQQVAEKGAHIGVSINAGIRCHEGEAEGKTGRIADSFVHAFSADFVTKAGAGGAPIVPVTESQRSSQVERKENTMTDEETKRLKEAEDRVKALEADNARFVAQQNVNLAVSAVGDVLKESGIELSPKALARICQAPVMKEGKVDAEWVKAVVADLTDGISAEVTGMGRGKEAAGDEMTADEQKAFEATLRELGIPEAGLKLAVGR